MMNPFELSNFFDPLNGQFSSYEMEPVISRNRVFLVAIQGGQLQHIADDARPMERVHVMVLRPGENPHFDSEISILGALPSLTPEMVPAVRFRGNQRAELRWVRGEILRDDNGRLYECTGRQISRLHQLASGPHGEILNFPSLAPSNRRLRPPHQDQGEPVYETTAVEAQAGTSPPVNDFQPTEEPAGSDNSPELRHPAATVPKPCRPLFLEPGQLRIVQFGDFKEMLTRQMAHPERLRDSHRLLCYVQIYEVTRKERFESLRAGLLGEYGSEGDLRLLDEATAAKLGLTPLLRNRPRLVRRFKQEAGWLLPFERLFRLLAAQDPSSEKDAPGLEQSRVLVGSTEANATASTAQRGSAPNPAGGKASIPETYMKPWEFKMSREEALYDMTMAASSREGFRSFRRRLRNLFTGRSEFRKWQVLLAGKGAEEQLWTVRPPREGLSHPIVRDWVQRTLTLAGYDPGTMLAEWEIFWRRKGL